LICIILPAILLITRYMLIQFYFFKFCTVSYLSVYIEAAYLQRLLGIPVVVSLSQFGKQCFRRMHVLQE
jgi:hypothetical protein